MRRWWFAIVVVVLVAGPAAASEGFKDVPADHWAAEAVNTLAQQGILKGYPDNTFRGESPVTRYELAITLARFAQMLQPVQQPPADKKSEAVPVADPGKQLVSGGYLPADSPILKDTSKPVSAEDLAQAMASLSARIIELRVPAPAEPAENAHEQDEHGEHEE